jgi:uncharacterized membrane protein HdeD (DUF308 family)
MILRGVAAVIFGLIALAYPGAAAGAFVIIFAVFAFADAILDFFIAATMGRAGLKWGWYVFAALISIAAGVVAIAYPSITFLALLFLVAARAIVTGFLEIGAAFSWRAHDDRWLLGVTGVLSVILGILLFSNPATGSLALIWSIGVYAIVLGAALAVLGIRMVRDRHELEDRLAPAAA